MWTVWTSTGVTDVFRPQLNTGTAEQPTASWYLTCRTDPLGNAVSYNYSSDVEPDGLGEQYLRRVAYNGTLIEFHGENRPDVLTRGTGRGLQVTRERLRSIDVKTGGVRVRAYALSYTTHDTTERSLLTQVRQYGRDATLDGTGRITGGTAMPPLTFTTQPGDTVGRWRPTTPPSDPGPTWHDDVAPSVFDGLTMPQQLSLNEFTTGDVDGDGRSDFVKVSRSLNGPPKVQFTVGLAGRPASSAVVDQTILWTDPAGLGWGLLRTWAADLNADGADDLLLMTERMDENETHLCGFGKVCTTAYPSFYAAISQRDGTFDLLQQPTTTWWKDLYGSDYQMRCEPGDADGDGRADLICVFNQWAGKEPTMFVGTAFSRGDGSFDLIATPAPDIGPFNEVPDLSVGDTDGDGISDAMLAYGMGCASPHGTPECGHFTFVTGVSQGNGGFAYTEHHTTFDGDGPLYGTDITGDGRADIFRIVRPVGQVDFSLQALTSRPDGSYVPSEQVVPRSLVLPDANPQNLPTWTVGDVDGDGASDLLLISRDDPHPASGCLGAHPEPHAVFTRVLSRRDGTFDWPSSLPACGISRERDLPWDDSIHLNGIRAPDVNGDGLADGFGAFGGFASAHEPLTVVDDVSPGTGADGFRAVLGDVTGDGRDDLVYLRSTGTGATAFTWTQRSDGSFTPKISHVLGSRPYPVTAAWKSGDITGDGRIDLVHVDRDGTGIAVDLLQANGDGTWTEHQRTAWPQYTTQFPDDGGSDTPNWRLADINGDGRADLIHLHRLGGILQVNTLLADGAGNWTPRPATAPAGSVGATANLSDTTNWLPADVNGDGRTDLVHVEYRRPVARFFTLISGGDGLSWRPSPDPAQTLLEGAPRRWLPIDTNADGQTDLVHLAGGRTNLTVRTMVSTGDGRWVVKSAPAAITVPAGTAVSFTDSARWRTADVNGDHRTDLVHVLPLGPGLRVDTLVSTGDGKWSPKAPVPDAWPGYARAGPPSWLSTDLDGDGRDDIVRVDKLSGGLTMSVLGSTTALDVTSTIDNGLGLRTEIRYESSRTGPHVHPATAAGCGLPAGAVLHVPTDIRQHVAGAQTERQTTTYGCARWSAAERRLLGWATVSERTSPTPNRPAHTLTTRFRLDEECPPQNVETQLQDDAGRMFTRTAVDYPPPSAANACLPEVTTVEQRNGGSVTQRSATSVRYDDFGNARQVAELGDPANPDDDRVRNLTFNPAVDRWIVGLPASEDLRDGTDPAARGYRRTVWCYDGDNGRPEANCPGRPTQGLLTAVKQLHNDGKYRTTTYGYDAVGNTTSVTDARGNTTTIGYDPLRHIYPEQICNALHQCSTAEWDRDLGVVKAVVDVNQARTEMTTNVHGWPETVSPPGGARVEISYLDWGDPNRRRIRQRIDDTTPDGLWSETWLDGLDRPHLLIREGDQPGRTYVRYTAYGDTSPLPSAESAWLTLPSGDPPAWEQMDYDVLGRPILQTHADGSALRWSYGNNATRTWVRQTSERGTVKQLFSDAHGGLDEVREFNGPFLSVLRYGYDAADQVRTVTDGPGNVTTYRYDQLGHLTDREDPDLGHWRWTWDAAGNLETQTDARGQTLAYTYDALNRPATRAYPKGGPPRATWHYDEPGHGAGTGRLTSVTDPTGQGCPAQRSRLLSYDPTGQVAADTRCVAGDSRTMQFDYDSMGRWKTITYPGGDQRGYGYDSAGRLREISGLIGEYTYDADGNLATAERADSTYTVWQRDPQRRWLRRISTSSPVTGALLDLTYSHEPDGLLRSSSARPGPTVSYRYDSLNRVTDVTGDFAQHFTWTSIGNLLHSSGVGTFSYPGPAPHAAVAAGNQTYRYDANGNTTRVETRTTRAHAGPARYTVRRGDTLWGIAKHYLGDGARWLQVWHLNQRQIRNPNLIHPHQLVRLPTQRSQARVTTVRRLLWNAENQLSAIIDQTGKPVTFRCDADGQRVEKRQGNRVVHFFGRWLQNAGKGTADVRYYWAGDRLVARSGPTTAQFYHQDVLGSTRMLTGGNGEVLARYDYQPFGAALGNTGTAATDLRFTGQRQDDETGLILAGARYYDPTRARFLSPDAIVPDPTATQAANRYLYAYGNPLGWTDPTGHGPQCHECIFEDDVIEGAAPSVVTTQCLACGFQLGSLQFSPTLLTEGSAAADRPRPTDMGELADLLESLPVEEAAEYLKREAALPSVKSIQNRMAPPPPRQLTAAELDAITMQLEMTFVKEGLPTLAGPLSMGLRGGGQVMGSVGPAINAAERFVQGPFGQVSARVLEEAAAAEGPAVTVFTKLTRAPEAGRALSVGINEGAEALAGQARAAGQLYTARIPMRLIVELQRVGLVQGSTTMMGQATAGELQFLPEASEFVVSLFRPVP